LVRIGQTLVSANQVAARSDAEMERIPPLQAIPRTTENHVVGLVTDSSATGGKVTAAVFRNAPQPAVHGLLAGFATALGGFGVLQVMWWAGEWPAGLAGHPDSRTGTVGDAVALPVLVGVLTGSACVLARRSPGRAPGERRIAIPVAVGGGAAGIAVQYAWWSDVRAIPHWGVPQPRHFSLPGWWHAVFLVTVSAWLASLYTVVVIRLRRTAQHHDGVFACPAGRRTLAAGSWAATSFLLLVLLDAAHNREGTATVATAVATAFPAGLACGALFWAAGRQRGDLRRPVGAGIVMATALAALCRRWPP
jgi:hypothetical protein